MKKMSRELTTILLPLTAPLFESSTLIMADSCVFTAGKTGFDLIVLWEGRQGRFEIRLKDELYV